jgi:hypothetical protein
LNVIRILPLIFALLSFASSTDAAQPSLHSFLKERLVATGGLPKMDEERTWAVNGFVPLQNIEVLYGYGDIDGNDFYTYNPLGRKHNDTIRFRFNIKSAKEMTTFFESRSLSRELVDLEKQEVLNQRRYDVYLEIVNQLLQARMLKMLGAREARLQKSLADSGQIMGLTKAHSKDLVRELERLQKVSAENEGLKAQDASLVSAIDVESSSQTLVDAVGRLAKKVASLGDSVQPLSVKHNTLEVRLQRIDKEVGWANDRKIFDHFDYQRDNLDKEDAVRVSFNIPFLRFDNESRARDRALLAVKEAEAARKSEATTAELRRARSVLFGLAAQVESLKQRLIKAREIEAKVKRVKDVELRSVLSDYSFELERDVLAQSLKFYSSYLEYLRDIGAFARMADRNLLDPEFKELG